MNMKKAIWITLGSIAGVFVLLAVIGGILAATGYKAPAASHTTTAAPAADPVTHTANPVSHTHSAPAPPVTTAPPAVTPTRRTVKILFTVTGTGYPSITYGSDSDNRSPSGSVGPLGDGNALPWQGSVKYHSDALYYDVSAQLEGSGDIRCAVILRVTQYYSDGTHISRSKVLQRGHAAGGYNICDAQENN